MLHTGYCWRPAPDSALVGAWVEVMLGNLNCCPAGVREDHLICPFSTQLFFGMSGVCSVRPISLWLTHQCSEHPSHFLNTSLLCRRLIISFSQSAVSTGTFLKFSVHL